MSGNDEAHDDMNKCIKEMYRKMGGLVLIDSQKIAARLEPGSYLELATGVDRTIMFS